jgi:hypothetical protein
MLLFLTFYSEELVYMSPEQTGRVNRSIDFRSDIYALVHFVKFSNSTRSI